jgi:hypothetical protein
MPVKSSLSGAPPSAPDDQAVGIQDLDHAPGSQGPDLPPAGEQAAAEQGVSDSSRALSPSERLVAERAERRHQRMVARESSTATRDPHGDERRQRATASSSALNPRGRQTLRRSLSAAVIGTLAAGAALGAVLGALSVPGWLIGLLVAGLTAVLATAMRPRSHSR